MHIRYLTRAFFHNRDLAALSPEHRVLFACLWTLADRDGRLEDRPGRIHAEVFPCDDDVDVAASLSDLARAGFITRDVVNGQRRLCIPPRWWSLFGENPDQAAH